MYIINWFPFWRNTFRRDGSDLRKQQEVRGYETTNEQEEYMSYQRGFDDVDQKNKYPFQFMNYVKNRIYYHQLLAAVKN